MSEVIWKQSFTLEDAATSRQGTMVDHVAIKFVEVGLNFLRAQMPVDERTRQPFGIMHGGASCVLAETVASVAANFCVDSGFYCVGVEINTSHIKTVQAGYVVGTAKPFHLGRSTQVWEIIIENDKGQLVSISRLRLAVLEKKDN